MFYALIADRPLAVTVIFFQNATTVHLECKGVDSACLFVFSGSHRNISFILQNNTTECVEIEDRYVSCHRVMMHIIFCDPYYTIQ